MSKNAIKVTVPKNVTPIGVAPGEYVEIKAISAGGVSNPIKVQIVKPSAGSQLPKPIADPSFTNPIMKIGFRYKSLGIEGVETPNRQPQRLSINLDDSPLKKDDKVDIEFKSNYGGFKLTNVAIDLQENKTDDISATISTKIFDEFSYKFGPENINPPKDVEFKATIKSGTKLTLPVKNTLTVQWVKIEPEKK